MADMPQSRLVIWRRRLTPQAKKNKSGRREYAPEKASLPAGFTSACRHQPPSRQFQIVNAAFHIDEGAEAGLDFFQSRSHRWPLSAHVRMIRHVFSHTAASCIIHECRAATSSCCSSLADEARPLTTKPASRRKSCRPKILPAAAGRFAVPSLSRFRDAWQ